MYFSSILEYFNDTMEFTSDQSIQLLEDVHDNDDIIMNDSIIFNNVNINEEVSTNNDITTNDRQRAKKSLPENWKRNSNYSLRLEGKAYLGYRRIQKNIFHDVLRKPRGMGSTCTNISCEKSTKIMYHKFSDQDRLNIFNYFWSTLNWDEKKMYVNMLVNKVPVKQRKTEAPTSRRNYTFFCFLQLDGDSLNVCKKMFLNTLNLGKSQVHNWCSNNEVGTKKPLNTRSRTTKNISVQKEFITNFFK